MSSGDSDDSDRVYRNQRMIARWERWNTVLSGMTPEQRAFVGAPDRRRAAVARFSGGRTAGMLISAARRLTTERP